jgi:hypothetical protein
VRHFARKPTSPQTFSSVSGLPDDRYGLLRLRHLRLTTTLSRMRWLVLLVAALVLALPAQASPTKHLRVDRPERGAGAKVTQVRLLKGSVGHRVRATVLTDTRCDPDVRGVSHCLNRVRLAGGAVVTVVHDHRMMDMPCLSPGEHVTLSPA